MAGCAVLSAVGAQFESRGKFVGIFKAAHMHVAKPDYGFALGRAHNSVNKFWGHWVAFMLRATSRHGRPWLMVATLKLYTLFHARTPALSLFKCFSGLKRVIPVLLPIHNSVTRLHTSPSFRHLGVELRHVLDGRAQDQRDQAG